MAKNLTIPHRFLCITDQNVDGVDCIPPVVNYQGWWQKIGLFYPGLTDGQAMYLDLDVVVTGSLDEMVAKYTNGGLWMTRNWSPSGHGGWQSSVMFWSGDAGEQIWDQFDYDNDSNRLWGDQEFITELMGERVNEMDPGEVVSYKYHCRGKGLPDGAKIVAFHGKPDYHECGDSWILQSTRI